MTHRSKPVANSMCPIAAHRALSIKRLRQDAQDLPMFSSPPLKSRTAGFPRSGFKHGFRRWPSLHPIRSFGLPSPYPSSRVTDVLPDRCPAPPPFPRNHAQGSFAPSPLQGLLRYSEPMRQSPVLSSAPLHEALLSESLPFDRSEDLPSFDASAFPECYIPYAGRSV